MTHVTHVTHVTRAVGLALAALALGACADPAGRDETPEPAPWREIVAADGMTCALDAAGAVRCISGTPQWRAPAAAATSSYTALSTSLWGACALSAAGRVSCWHREELPWSLDAGGATFRAVAGGPDAGCGLAADGAPHCWRAENVPSRAARAVAVAVRGAPPLVAVSHAGGAFACGLTSGGEAVCWHLNTSLTPSGELGDGRRDTSTAAVRVRTDARFASLTVGATHACGLTAAGEAYCWGSNTGKELGVPRTPARGDCFVVDPPATTDTYYGCTTPQRVPTALRFRQLEAAMSRTCGLATDGRTYCWGANLGKSLGVPSAAEDSCRFGRHHFDCTAAPVAVTDAPPFARLGASGVAHQCALAGDGRAYCWGHVRADGVPLMTTVYEGRPTPVMLPEAGG